jgi:hypothetical protein
MSTIQTGTMMTTVIQTGLTAFTTTLHSDPITTIGMTSAIIHGIPATMILSFTIHGFIVRAYPFG